MTSTKKKVAVNFVWNVDPNLILADGSVESERFGTSNTVFYLKAYQNSYIFQRISQFFELHLESSQDDKISFDLKLTFNDDNSDINKFSGDVFYKNEFKMELYFPTANSFKSSWELTFEESEPISLPIDHHAAFSRQMSSFRNDASSADMTLVTTLDRMEYPVHKFILSLRSPVFAAMFSHDNLKENQTNRVEIDDISGQVMEALLKYIYECDVQGIEKIAADLLPVVDKYDIPLLVKECIQSMAKNLSVSNAAHFFYLTSLHQLEELKKSVGKFIVANKGAIRQSAGFKEFIEPEKVLLMEFIDLLV